MYDDLELKWSCFQNVCFFNIRTLFKCLKQSEEIPKIIIYVCDWYSCKTFTFII